MNETVLGLLILIAAAWAFIAMRRPATQQRAQAINALAEKQGLHFTPGPESTTPVRLSVFELFNKHRGATSNLIEGSVIVGERRCRITSGDFAGKVIQRDPRAVTLPVEFGFVAIELPVPMPGRLLLRRETLSDRLADIGESNDIDFASAAFSKRFFVAASERKFANDFFDPRMIDFLLDNEPPVIRIVDRFILLTRDDRPLKVDEVELMLDWTRRFVEHVPRMLWEGLQR
jgi:hypothetical protein